MSCTFYLGSNIFSAPRSRQCLLSRASATLLLPKESALPTTLEQITNSRSIWVVNGRDLTLDICIQGPCDGLGPMSSFLNQCVDLLRGAKLWTELGLVMSMKSYECEPNSDHTMTLRFTLTIQEDFKRTIRGMHGKVPRPIQRCISIDPRPPPGIVTVKLSNLQVSLRYLSSTSTCVSRMDRSWMKESLEDIAITECDDAEKLESGKRIPMSWLGYNASTTSASSPRYSQFPPGLYFSGMEAAFPHHNVSQSITEENTEVGGDDYQFYRLLDCAIRNLISDNPLKSAYGIKQFNSNGTHRLSDIAPSVFSPGYHDSVRQRAGFIPAVAKSIASIANRSASERTRQELTDLGNFFQKNYEGSSESELPDLRSMIKCLLWTSLQKGVYDRKFGRKLSPMTAADWGGEDDSSMLEDQLSVWSDDALSTSLDIESDCADINTGYYDNDYDEYGRSLFEEDSSFPFSDSVSSGSDDLIDVVSRFSVSENEEEEDNGELLLARKGHKQEEDEEPCHAFSSVNSVEKEFAATSGAITGYTQQRRGRSFSKKNKIQSKSYEEPHDNNARQCKGSASPSTGFQSSPLTLNEEMLSPRMEPGIGVDTWPDMGSLGSSEEDLLEEEESLIGNESFGHNDGDEEMLY